MVESKAWKDLNDRNIINIWHYRRCPVFLYFTRWQHFTHVNHCCLGSSTFILYSVIYYWFNDDVSLLMVFSCLLDEGQPSSPVTYYFLFKGRWQLWLPVWWSTLTFSLSTSLNRINLPVERSDLETLCCCIVIPSCLLNLFGVLTHLSWGIKIDLII